MNKEELVENLGTIAKSGTKSFLANLSGDKKKIQVWLVSLVLAFYSAFMVANKIDVISRKAGEETAYMWAQRQGRSMTLQKLPKRVTEHPLPFTSKTMKMNF